MTLAEKLKQVEASAEALRRELEVEQACSFATMLARAIEGETAFVAARKAFADAERAWTDHQICTGGRLTSERAQSGHAIQQTARDCHSALRGASKARDAALEDLKAAAKAATTVAARVTAETDRSIPKWSAC